MNHLLNKDGEYVLHIYEEEMKASPGWGRGEGPAELMASQAHRIKPGAVLEGPRRREALAAQLPVGVHGRVLDAF